MIHFAAVAAFTTLRYLQRVCPTCGNVQVEPLTKAGQPVTCDHCGYRIPPRVAA